MEAVFGRGILEPCGNCVRSRRPVRDGEEGGGEVVAVDFGGCWKGGGVFVLVRARGAEGDWPGAGRSGAAGRRWAGGCREMRSEVEAVHAAVGVEGGDAGEAFQCR